MTFFTGDMPDYLNDMIEGDVPAYPDLEPSVEHFEPAPVEEPVEPAPVEEPVEPAPVEPAPVEEPVEPAPVEEPIEPAPVVEPVEPAPVEPAPVEEPIEPAPVEPAPTEEIQEEGDWNVDTQEPEVTVEPAAEDVDLFQPDAAPLILDEDFFAYDGVAGNQFAWHNDWFFQEVYGYCGPSSVAIILNEFLGEGITNPEYMVEAAIINGFMGDPSLGMTSENIAGLLTSQGVPAEVQYSSIDDLATKLEMGYGVIACVDGGEIWLDNDTDIYGEDDQSDHALVVTEINFNDGSVTLADPGTPDGNALTVPIAQFEDAWADSSFEMIATTGVNLNLADPALADQHMAIVNATRSDVIR